MRDAMAGQALCEELDGGGGLMIIPNTSYMTYILVVMTKSKHN